MSLFSHANCIAITWDAHGRFRAILAEKHGGTTKVAAVWSREVKGNQALAQVVQEAIRELGATADTAVIIGGNAGEAGIFDVRLPKMPAEDMRGAIEFRLGAQVPMGVDDIFWGYRVTDRGSDQVTARVSYVRREIWDQWLEAANGSPIGVDVIIPPQAVLDPVCGDRSVCLDHNFGENTCFMLEVGENGTRQVRLASSGPATVNAFGANSDAPLKHANLELGPLAEQTPVEQLAFTGCALLAVYGLSDAMAADKRDWPAVPAEMRPKRNRVLKYWTAGVAIYLVFILTLLITSHFHRNYVRLKLVQKDTARLTTLTQALEKQLLVEDPGVVLKQEFDEVGPQRISMVKTLAHISALTPDELWVTNFSWEQKNGAHNVSIELRGDQDQDNSIQALSQTPLLEGFKKRQSLSPGNRVSYSLSATVVDPDELPALPPLPKVEPPSPPVVPDDDTIPVEGADDDEAGVDEDDGLTPPPPPPPPSFPGSIK